jgi:hypothetical protein
LKIVWKRVDAERIVLLEGGERTAQRPRAMITGSRLNPQSVSSWTQVPAGGGSLWRRMMADCSSSSSLWPRTFGLAGRASAEVGRSTDQTLPPPASAARSRERIILLLTNSLWRNEALQQTLIAATLTPKGLEANERQARRTSFVSEGCGPPV